MWILVPDLDLHTKRGSLVEFMKPIFNLYTSGVASIFHHDNPFMNISSDGISCLPATLGCRTHLADVSASWGAPSGERFDP